jgi:tetratricopeptide (TPR) repeat protein
MRGQLSARLRRCSRFAALALAATLASAPIVGVAAPEPEPASGPEGASEAERKQAARAQVRLGSAAFGAGDFELAIEHYEAAIALLPAPKLHYNLGVCHQRLSLSAEDPEQRTRERDLAIESYNAYLEQNPRAEDRLEVAATIRELGGAPATMPTLMPLFEGEELPALDPDPEPVATPVEPVDAVAPEPAPAPAPAWPYPHLGRFGVALAGGYSPTLHAADAIGSNSMLAFDLHGGAFVGPRRRLLIAAHASLYSGLTLNQNELALVGYSLGLLGQQTWVVGREAVSFGLGGVVALTGQALETRGVVPAPACRTGADARVASRTGALLAPRFEVAALLGARRRGMLGLLVQPSFGFFGDGQHGTGCEPGETPWTSLGVRRRWQFQLWVGAGFSFRF